MSKPFLKIDFFVYYAQGLKENVKWLKFQVFFIHLIISWRKFSCQENNGDLRENRK